VTVSFFAIGRRAWAHVQAREKANHHRLALGVSSSCSSPNPGEHCSGDGVQGVDRLDDADGRDGAWSVKKWIVLLAVVAAVAGGAYAARWQGIDLVALSGIRTLIQPAQKAEAGADRKPATAKPAGGQNRGPQPVEVARAASRKLTDDIVAIGTLLAEESVVIAPETSGRIAEILFKDGDTVAAKTPLFQLDADLAKAALAEAEARLKLAESSFKRNTTLRKSGNVAASALDISPMDLAVARSAIETARVNLAKLTVTAPFAGTLAFREVSPGAYVTAGSALVRLDKIDLLRVRFAVPELQEQRIALGQELEVSVDALPGKTFIAKITGIDPAVDVTGRALQVRAALDNSTRELRPGLLARVTVKGQPREAVTVPEAAIVQQGDSAFVFLIEDAKARQAKVRLGRRVPGAIEVLEGVAAGAEVVVAGNTRLANGAEVEIVKSPMAVE
jgi:membrane fusion protein, multidrug efflux system